MRKVGQHGIFSYTHTNPHFPSDSGAGRRFRTGGAFSSERWAKAIAVTTTMAISNENDPSIQPSPVANFNEHTTTMAAAAAVAPDVPKVDIEHVTVYDDPRQWSRARKVHLSAYTFYGIALLIYELLRLQFLLS